VFKHGGNFFRMRLDSGFSRGRVGAVLAPVSSGEIRRALEEAGVRPSRQLGQNFLADPEQARWIVDQLGVGPEHAVVEVGPGTGALSGWLAGRARRLILIEFDARLAAWLERRFAGEPEVVVHHADGARFDPRVLWKERPLCLLGNLPYSAGGAILRNFLSRPNPFERAVVMLQHEVVERLAASPRTKAYGVLSLRMQSEWRVEPLRTLAPECFVPRPAIDSTVVRLEPRGDELPVFDARGFDALVRRGFAQRRKQLRKALPEGLEWPALAERLGVAETARAEELSLAQWVELARTAEEAVVGAQRGDERFEVVDEEDRVIGEATRDEVHARGLMHRAVHVFVVNRRGELLLQRRSRLKDVHPRRWGSSVSGHLDRGEDYEAAARREMEEEMGIVEAKLEEVARIAPSEANGWEHLRLYLARWDGRPRFPSAEVEAVLWLAAEEVEGWLERRPEDFSGGFRECWEAARGRR